MTTLDWIAVGLIALMALAGARRGLIASALGLVGIVIGAVVGARLAPHLLHEGSESPYTPLVGLAGAILFAGLLQALGQMVGSIARSGLRIPPLRTIDTVGGLLLGGAMGVAAVWVLGAAALHVPGQTEARKAALQSVILRRLNDIAPPDSVLRALARIDPFPTIAGPPPPGDPPDPRVLRRPGVGRAGPSVVRVVGSACGLGVEGSGWVYRRGLVVTAAHVVAGETDTTVQPFGSSRRLRATAIAYDRRNDVAVLAVPELRAQPLRLQDPTPGTPVAILGYPEDGPFDAEPGRLGRTTPVLPRPGKSLPRLVTSVRGLVRHGNSGGPVVDARGVVRSMIFAAQSGTQAGYGVPPTLVRAAAAHVGSRVSTGDCGE